MKPSRIAIIPARGGSKRIPRKNIREFHGKPIIAYSIVMSVLSIFGKNDSEFLSSLIIIPITGQMLHFYLDSQLWKFSEQHNRENILRYL